MASILGKAGTWKKVALFLGALHPGLPLHYVVTPMARKRSRNEEARPSPNTGEAGGVSGIMNPGCERCGGSLVPVEYGMPASDEPYRRHERREIYFTGSCMGGPEPWWCWSCERYADPEPRPPRTLTKEGYQLSLLDDMRRMAPQAVLEPPAPYDDPPAHLLEEAGRWSALQSPKIKDLAAILGDPVSGGPSRHRFALPLWPDFWLEHTTLDTEVGEYVVNRRFVRRSDGPMRSPDELRPWSVLLPEAQAFFGWEESRMPNAYWHVVPFQLQGRRMQAWFVHHLLQHVSESSDGEA